MPRANTFEMILALVQQCEHGETCTECCWLWTGQVDHKGYGKVSYLNVKRIVHSLLFKWKTGIPIATRINALHTCDTPLCCNWNHIYSGSPQDNSNDRVNRDRQPKGDEFPQAKMTEQKVRLLRELYNLGEWSTVELAAFFSIGQTTAWRIIKGEDWKHVRAEFY